MTKVVEPGDITIKSLKLFNKKLNAEFSPIDQVIGIDIYEDMSKPTMYATLAFSDNIGILSSFPIIGEEEVEIEVQSPGATKSTKFTFRSFEVANVQPDPNGKGQTYILKCVSEEHLYNGSSVVVESFNDIISNMVPVFLSNQKYLNSKKDVIIDQTKGIQTIPFPKISPLQAIDMVRKRAVSKDFPSSSYVFFENQSGFNFKTIEGLIKDNKPFIGSRIFNAQQNVMASKENEALSYRTILAHQSIARSDSNIKAAAGIFKAVTKTFDLATKSFESADFDLTKVFKGFEKPGDNKQIPNTTEFIEKFASGRPRQYFTPKDTTRPDTFIDTAIAVRNSFAVLLNSDITRILIHGESGLKVGDIVTLNLPEPTGTTDRKKADLMTSGNYMIIRLRHMINISSKTKHQISFDCVKMGV